MYITVKQNINIKPACINNSKLIKKKSDVILKLTADIGKIMTLGID